MTPNLYQIIQSTSNLQTILSFQLHADSKGTEKSDPWYCGPKTYTVNVPWMTVVTPLNPDENYLLQVNTNNY